MILYRDRFEVKNPGGLYGRMRIDQLGKVQPDTRNPAITIAMETLHETENRYSGIPIMRRELAQAGMPEPEFRIEHGTFIVCFRLRQEAAEAVPNATLDTISEKERGLLQFCSVYRTRKEIADYLGLSSVAYAIRTQITPLVQRGLLQLEVPAHPRSPKQRYKTV